MCSPNDHSMVGVFDPCPRFPDCEHYPRACPPESAAESAPPTDGLREEDLTALSDALYEPAENASPPIAWEDRDAILSALAPVVAGLVDRARREGAAAEEAVRRVRALLDHMASNHAFDLGTVQMIRRTLEGER